MKKINNMKKNSVIVMMLCVMVTSGLASCEKEKEESPAPSPYVEPVEHNPFRGTTW